MRARPSLVIFRAIIVPNAPVDLATARSVTITRISI